MRVGRQQNKEQQQMEGNNTFQVLQRTGSGTSKGQGNNEAGRSIPNTGNG